MRPLVLTLTLCIAGGVIAPPAVAVQDGLLSREEALASVYPGAEIVAERVFLTEGQVAAVAELAGAEVRSALVARYRALVDGEEIGRAYVDTHVVRTKRESLLVSLDVDGRVRRIDVTAFLEPPEYMASEAWIRQYYGEELADDLDLNRAIRPIAGATLTVHATNDAVRRVLAIDAVLARSGGDS